VHRALVSSIVGRNEAVIKPGWGQALRLVDLRSEALPGDSVGFRFRSEREALRCFAEDHLTLRSLRGLHHPVSWLGLIRGMLSVKHRMGTHAWERVSEAELLVKTLFTLRAAVAGLNGLKQLDAFTGGLFEQLPQGWIHLHIIGAPVELPSIGIHRNGLSWSTRAKAVGGQSVDFEFRSPAIAWKSVANLADNLAAVGKGDIKLRGYIPLADGFNHLLDRLQMYVSAT
jgi:hypothetical protein